MFILCSFIESLDAVVGRQKAHPRMHSSIDSRYSFAPQFLNAAARMATLASAIEARPIDSIDSDLRSEHLAFTSSAVMQSVAALEADSWEVVNHGPGHHLGTSPANSEAIARIEPLAEILESVDALRRYSAILHLLSKPSLDKGAQPWQDAKLLIRLRNEITHYKSRSGAEMDRAALYSALKSKSAWGPPFWPEKGVNFFPLQCLGAQRAVWAVRTTVALITAVYERFGVKSPLAGYPESWSSFPQ